MLLENYLVPNFSFNLISFQIINNVIEVVSYCLKSFLDFASNKNNVELESGEFLSVYLEHVDLTLRILDIAGENLFFMLLHFLESFFGKYFGWKNKPPHKFWCLIVYIFWESKYPQNSIQKSFPKTLSLHNHCLWVNLVAHSMNRSLKSNLLFLQRSTPLLQSSLLDLFPLMNSWLGFYRRFVLFGIKYKIETAFLIYDFSSSTWRINSIQEEL